VRFPLHGRALLDYCGSATACADKYHFRMLFLDKRNRLIADEVEKIMVCGLNMI
jgi:DNA repair protein RadC